MSATTAGGVLRLIVPSFLHRLLTAKDFALLITALLSNHHLNTALLAVIDIAGLLLCHSYSFLVYLTSLNHHQFITGTLLPVVQLQDVHTARQASQVNLPGALRKLH